MNDKNGCTLEIETERIRALQAYHILDTDPEPAYDTLTKLAAELCSVPISLVSLVDEKRQWFKSRIGLDATETPRDISFCSHAIQNAGMLEVSDTREHPDFSGNPLVVGPPGIRFYAGVPLTTRQGHRLGTLCVIDQKPRSLTDFQRLALRALGDQVVAQLDLRKTISEKEKALERLTSEIDRRAEMELAQHAAMRFMHETIDALPDHLAIVDRAGKITHVNRAWQLFAKGNADPALHFPLGMGANYLEVCDRAAARGSKDAEAIATTLRCALRGEAAAEISLEYSCHSPNEDRWFIARVSGFFDGRERHAIISHQNITPRIEAEMQVQDLNTALEARVRGRTMELEDANAELRALSSRLQTIREQERTTISREIHDDLGQMLTALKIDLTLLRRDSADFDRPLDRTRLGDDLDSLERLVDTTLRSVKRIAQQLRPETLDALGLIPAVEWQASELTIRTGIHCKVKTATRVPALDSKTSTVLFRVVQEALTNVARHSGASKVLITLDLLESALCLTIADDGRGFAAGPTTGAQSLGLIGMRERTAEIGASFQIDSRPGDGTSISVIVPLGTELEQIAGS